MKILKNKDYLSSIESSERTFKSTEALNNFEELSSFNVLHVDVERPVVLIDAMHVNLEEISD